MSFIDLGKLLCDSLAQLGVVSVGGVLYPSLTWGSCCGGLLLQPGVAWYGRSGDLG